MHRKQVNTQHSKLYRRVRKLQKRLTQHSGRIDAGLVHDIRVLCKKVRAELTLLKYKKKKVRLKMVSKEIAGSLSQIRDAEVMLGTFDGLFPETCEVPLKKLRQGLVAELNKQAIDGQSLNARVGVLKRELKDCSFSLGKGVENPVSINKAKAKSYRRFMQLDVANSETFHDWRKSVKAYFYLLQLDQTVKPAKLSVVRKLAESLGLLHDLHVFQEMIALHYPEYLPALQGRVTDREKVLLEEIYRLANELYEIRAAVCLNNETG